MLSHRSWSTCYDTGLQGQVRRLTAEREQVVRQFVLYILPTSSFAILSGGLLVFGADRFGARRRHLEWLVAILGYGLVVGGGLLFIAWL